MSAFTTDYRIVTTLSIPNAGSDSDTLDLTGSSSGSGAAGILGRRLISLLVITPAALTAAVTLQVSLDGGSTFEDFCVNGATPLALAAGKATMIPEIVGCMIKFHSAGVEGAQRDFKVVGVARSQSR